MAKILFTWEIGQGTGHVLPSLPILELLAAQGHEIFVALRDVRWLGDVLSPYGFKILQAPAHPEVKIRADGPQPNTMTDILALFGFASPTVLSGLVRAWHDLMDLVQPDLVLASYAPVSLLVARSRQTRTALLALPFELPPREDPLPSFRPGVKVPAATAVQADEKVLATIRETFGPKGIAPLSITGVYEVFDADATFLLTFPEFDWISRDPTKVEYVGILFPKQLSEAIKPVWPTLPQEIENGTSRPKVFAYLHVQLPRINELREEIKALPYDFFVVLADAPTEELQRWRAPNVAVSAVRVDMDSVLAQADAVLCNGGHSTVGACALAGKPMVLLPREFEQGMTALRVCDLGLGILLEAPPVRRTELRDVLRSVLLLPKHQKSGQSFSDKYKDQKTDVLINLRIKQMLMDSQNGKKSL